MASLGGIWELADVLSRKARRTEGRVPATYLYTDDDGTAWVLLAGADEPTPVTGMVTADLRRGDVVEAVVGGGLVSVSGNASAPSVGERVVSAAIAPVRAAVSRATESIVMVRSIADAAKAVADAIEQHFWTDTNGIHVTHATQKDWETSQSGPNVLINSVGQLFRDGLNNLVAITTENGARAISFFDGAGNDVANITAYFGGSGARIGHKPTPDSVALYQDAGGVTIRAVNNNVLEAIIGMYAYGESVTQSLPDPYGEWTRTLDYTPALASPVTVYDINYQSRKIIEAEFIAGTPSSVQIGDDGTLSYDGSTTLRYSDSGSSVAEYSWHVLYYKSGDRNYPTLHVGKIGNLDQRGRNTASVGEGLFAISDNQFVIGKNNDPDYSGDYPFIIGNGEYAIASSNAFTVDWNGNVRSAGNLLYLDAGSYGTSHTYLEAVDYSTGATGTRVGSTRKVSGTDIYNNINLNILADGTRQVRFSSAVPWQEALDTHYLPGDTISGSCRAGGYVTNSSKDIRWTIPLSKPVSGSVSCMSMGMTVRMAGTYIYGTSSGNANVPVGALTCAVTPSGIDCQYRASAAISGATNNSECSVQVTYSFTVS